MTLAVALALAVGAQARDSAIGNWRRNELRAGPDRRPVDQREWAARMVEALGLADSLPPDHREADVYSLLCPARSERTVSADGRRVPTRPPFHVRIDQPTASDDSPLRMVVAVPATALYTLRVTGSGHARWAVDRRDVGSIDPTRLGVDVGDRLVPLARGPHEIEAVPAQGSDVVRIELNAFRPLCIAPGAGWNAEQPLRFGDKARTMVAAFGLEGRLPAEGDPLVLEGEAFEEGDPRARRIQRGLRAPASGGGWATAEGGPAELAWRIRLDHPGLFSVVARVSGGSRQLWSVDGRHEVRVAAEPKGDGFVWSEVSTLPLDAGEHVLRARIPSGSAVDVLHLVRRRTRDADYLQLLGELGFEEGPPAEIVDADAAAANLRNPTFAILVGDLLQRVGGGPGDPLAVLADELERHFQRPLSPVVPADLVP